MKRLILLLTLTTSLAAAPRRFIVEFTDAPPTAKTIRNRFANEATKIDVHHEYTRTFHGAAVELPEGTPVEALARVPNVRAVWEDGEVVAFGASLWGQVSGVRGPVSVITNSRSGAKSQTPSPRPPTPNSAGHGVTIAILDTGIDATHPALAGKVIGGYDFVNDDNDPMDDHRHGTHVAGIIAAQGQVTGVAPEVKLLAYKVLGANGKGLTSDIIAALERAVDPNGDGNPIDHADIANLSLGGSGRPDDPLSRAVDNAVAAGVVVVVAAGNDELFHRIGSPAGAARAITVGASTIEEGVETIAYFSSRGPATQTAAIKPDLLAPGVDIVSTVPGSGYAPLSGTSMATPHVSGLAALILEQHPDWTPDRVKAALVTSARAIVEQEVMTQGAGIADVTRALANVLVPSSTQFNFGLDATTAATYTATRRITIRNESNGPKVVHPAISGANAAITFDVAPSQLTLAAGATADLDVTLHVDHTKLGEPESASLAFSGVVTLDQVRLPWAFVRAGRLTITAENGLENLVWGSDVPRYASPASIGPGGYEVLLEPATYDIVMAAKSDDGTRVVVAENQLIEGDVALTMNAAMTPHEVRLASVDASGTPFPDGDGETTLRSSIVRLVLPREYSIPLPVEGRTLHTSSFSDRFALLATEAYVDRAAGRMYVAQYEPLRALAADRVLQVSPGEYAAQQITLDFPSTGTRRDVTIMPRDFPRRFNEFSSAPPFLKFAVNAPSWHGTLYMTRESHPDFASGVQLAMHTAGDIYFPAAVIAPMIRRNAHGFFATRGFTDSPLPVSAIGGEVMAFGRGAIHMPGLFRVDEQGVGGDGEIYGNRGERRRSETLTTKVRVFRADDTQVSTGVVNGGGFFVPIPGPGAYRIELRQPSFSFDDRSGEATLTMRVDTTHGMASPPSITSLAILDGAGRHATRLPANGNASLVFSAADHDEYVYRRVTNADVFFRRRGSNAWIELTAVATGDEETADNLGRWPAGLVFRVDLADALRLGPGEYEVAIEVRDEEGITSTWQIAPAFLVETAVTQPRRRAAGK